MATSSEELSRIGTQGFRALGTSKDWSVRHPLHPHLLHPQKGVTSSRLFFQRKLGLHLPGANKWEAEVGGHGRTHERSIDVSPPSQPLLCHPSCIDEIRTMASRYAASILCAPVRPFPFQDLPAGPLAPSHLSSKQCDCTRTRRPRCS